MGTLTKVIVGYDIHDNHGENQVILVVATPTIESIHWTGMERDKEEVIELSVEVSSAD
jgi:hypothetical protein